MNTRGWRTTTMPCARCGKPFESLDYRRRMSPAFGRYCSTTCCNISLAVGRKPPMRTSTATRQPAVEQTCKNCPKTFMATPSDLKRGKGKYCSRACMLYAPRVTRTCPTCSTSFSVLVSNRNRGRGEYCSVPCKKIGQRVTGSTRPPEPKKFARVFTVTPAVPDSLGPLIELDLRARGYVRCHACSATRPIGQRCACEREMSA